MRLAVMQPYFFPYLGYFSLIAATDRFVVFDPVQYIRHGWINRNRILKPGFGEPQYISVPLAKHARDTTIRDIRIASEQDWQKRIFGQLQHYKKKAPHFAAVHDIVERCLNFKTDRIVDLNVHCLQVVCDAIDVQLKLIRFEDIAANVGVVEHAGEWALRTALAMQAECYINPIGGRELFDAALFRSHGIGLSFLEPELKEYPQAGSPFNAGLSIVDVMMFCGLDETKRLVRQYRIQAA